MVTEGEPEAVGQSATQDALLFVGVSMVAGLDLLPNLATLIFGGRLYPTLFWWGETTSPWPGTLPFVPHHYAGLAMAMMGYLLLHIAPDETGNHPRRWMQIGLSGICFAATLGTSTFLAAAVMAAAAVSGLDNAVRGRWAKAVAVFASLSMALALDWFYIVPTFLQRAPGAVWSGAPLKLVLAHWHQAYGLTGKLLQVLHLPQGHGLRAYLVSLPVLVALYVIDLGFFWIVLGWKVKKDLGSSQTLPEKTRALWCLFGTCAALSTWVSSAPLQQGLNDFGRHTNLAMRLVLMLWACPMIASVWKHRSTGTLISRRWLITALCLGAVGIAGTAWDVAVQRIYLPLVDTGRIRPRDPFFYSPGVGLRYAEIAEAWQAIGTSTAEDAVVQGNPDGPLQRPLLLYLERRVAAGDIECEASFGGDGATCASENVRPLLALYAQPEKQWKHQVAFDTSPSTFITTCRKLRLTAMIVTDYDPVWQQKDSWVWLGQSLYTGKYVRVMACPESER